MLDRRFFELAGTKHHGNNVFESYKAVHARSTVVLFSRQSYTPLAALTLNAKDAGCLSMLTGRPSPKSNASQPYFQGMLSMPNQNFSFVITNLSDMGMINFNILHTPHRVSEVDPGPAYGVNQVNELHANQSCEITADQRTNRAMILKGKVDTKFDPKTKKMKSVPLTVDESESTTDKSKEGLYFYLSVVPDSSSMTLKETFKEGATWRVVAGFVLKRAPNWSDDRRLGPPCVGATASLPEEGSIQCCSVQPSMSRAGRAPMGASARLRGTPRDFRGSAGMGGFTFPGSGGAWGRGRSWLRGSAGKEGFANAGSACFATNADVGSTQAGELCYGDHVDVRSFYSGHEYAYEHASEPTVLCLSIWEDMKFLPLLDTVDKMLEAEVKDRIDNEGKALIESLNAVYKEEKCVIDLESEADTIVCACGHQCVNHENISRELRRCPLCRSPITAFVRANGIVI